jgi:hypothetical protein
MKANTVTFYLLFSLSPCLLVCPAKAGTKPLILRTPDGGVQPQAAMDANGTLHLVYLKGNPAECDVFYVRWSPGSSQFSKPLRVNSQRGSAVAMGTIRGAQIALGKDQRVHVAWNGSMAAQPKAPNNGMPMLYARLDDSGQTFEPQRNLMQQTFNLDGGGTITADGKGNVYVAWHGRKVGSEQGEENRQVWVARSTDDGQTFARETLASPQPTGTCGCCGMRGFLDSKGTLRLLYRAASQKVNRDMFLLTSNDAGKTFDSALVQRWQINGCPMSSQAFAEGAGKVVAAWETKDQIYFTQFAVGSGKLSPLKAAPRTAKARKHPALAVAPSGEMLLAWTEGTGWNKGGALVWQVFDASGKPTSERGRINGGIPVWGLPAAAATPQGEFILIH